MTDNFSLQDGDSQIGICAEQLIGGPQAGITATKNGDVEIDRAS
jgi:hypothetical protein